MDQCKKCTPEVTKGLLCRRELTPELLGVAAHGVWYCLVPWCLTKAVGITAAVFPASWERQLLNKVNWYFGRFCCTKYSTSGESWRSDRRKYKWPPEQGTAVENLSCLRCDFKRSWIPSRSCFLKHLHVSTLHILKWACKTPAWMGTLQCGGLHDSL